MTIDTTIKYAGRGFLAAAAVLAFSLPAGAQTQTLPSYATGSTDETIHGTVASVDGSYAISVRDERGFIDNVRLHQGTIINPTGLTLASGQTVTILGHTQGNVFSANQIDTPYKTVGYAYGYGYPGYGAYPFGYGYGYGAYPFFGAVGFGFGRGRFGVGI